VADNLRERALPRLARRHVDGVLKIVAADQRTQQRNREAARERLAEVLRTATAPPPKARRASRPTKGSQRRRLESKARRGAIKKLRGRPED
jgi:ribosome-associated protein